jgi:hypothetical protein
MGEDLVGLPMFIHLRCVDSISEFYYVHNTIEGRYVSPVHVQPYYDFDGSPRRR